MIQEVYTDLCRAFRWPKILLTKNCMSMCYMSDGPGIDLGIFGQIIYTPSQLVFGICHEMGHHLLQRSFWLNELKISRASTRDQWDNHITQYAEVWKEKEREADLFAFQHCIKIIPNREHFITIFDKNNNEPMRCHDSPAIRYERLKNL